MQAMRKGNHRRTKSTHPDELNKMMFSLAAKDPKYFDNNSEMPSEVIVEEVKELPSHYGYSSQ